MHNLGVVANIQPQFVRTDAAWARRRLGPTALAHAYAWKSLLEAGVACAGGSDAPVETPEPLKGIYSAMFRDAGPVASGGPPDTSKCLAPGQCLTLAEVGSLPPTPYLYQHFRGAAARSSKHSVGLPRCFGLWPWRSCVHGCESPA